MKRFNLLAAILTLGVYGCGSHPESVPDPGTKTDTTAMSSEPAKSTSPSTMPSLPSTQPTGQPEQTPRKAGTQGSKPGTTVIKRPGRPPLVVPGWSPSKVSPEVLASGVDKKMGSLASFSAKVFVRSKDSHGSGLSNCLVSVKSKSQYRIEFPTIGEVNKGITKDALVADGQNVALIRSDGQGPKEPLPGSPLKTEIAPTDWVLRYPAVMFAPVRGGHPLTDLVSALRKQKNLYQLAVEDRTFEYVGHNFHQRRLVVKTIGFPEPTVDMTFVFDLDFMLPVTIDVANDLSKSTATACRWTAEWNTNQGQKFDPKLFMIPLRSQKITR